MLRLTNDMREKFHTAVELSAIEMHWGEGERALKSGAFAEAITHCKHGIVMLGNEYASADIIDDSAQRLALASAKERAGDIQIAATLYCGILATRIAAYKAKLNKLHEASR
jgi:hypothetical protein